MEYLASNTAAMVDYKSYFYPYLICSLLQNWTENSTKTNTVEELQTCMTTMQSFLQLIQLLWSTISLISTHTQSLVYYKIGLKSQQKLTLCMNY